ncbi:MAG: hypothetical protein KC910_16595, partial [Candidatus Eremiobacteraeota bacterium]|nr:hypothetical protein [Candidatus Eremiobacteraeota bacterium]
MRPLVWLLLTIALTGCAAPTKELGRTPSPDNKLDAILAIKETGATVSTPTQVYVVNHGERLGPNLNPVLKADHVEEMELVWNSDSELVVRAKKARLWG